MPPPLVPWPAKMTFKHRLGCPSRHGGHVQHGMAGSIATRSPVRGPQTTVPAIS